MVMPLDTAQPHQFTDHPDDDVQPTWSPDATQLAFVSNRSGSWQLWVAGIKDGRRQGDPWQLTDSEATAMAPSWSPDGRLIAFLGQQGNSRDVFVVAPDAGSSPRQVTRDVQAAAVAWNPATDNLLVAAPWDEKNVSLRRYAPDGRDIGPTRYPIVFGENTQYTRFAVCPDGRLIVYVRQRLTGDVWLLESEEQPY
jgi:TolB protein